MERNGRRRRRSPLSDEFELSGHAILVEAFHWGKVLKSRPDDSTTKKLLTAARDHFK
jgi:hypothetical protein